MIWERLWVMLFIVCANITTTWGQEYTASKILLVRPANFNCREGAKKLCSPQPNMQEIILKEFDSTVQILKTKEINVFVFEDTKNPIKPNAVFPSKWVSFHPNGMVILYPIANFSERSERRLDIVNGLKKQFIFTTPYYELGTENETENQFLEGTDALVLDYERQNVYFSISPKNSQNLFNLIASQILSFTPYIFHAIDYQKQVIAETNKIMSIGDKFAVICGDAFVDINEKNMVYESLTNGDKKIIEISLSQMDKFAGNIIQIRNRKNKFFILMSENAFQSLKAAQISELEKYGEILKLPISMIESIGNKSVGSMIVPIYAKQVTQ